MVMDKKVKEKETLKEILKQFIRRQIAETCGKQEQILKERKDTLKQKRVVEIEHLMRSRRALSMR